MPPADAPGFCKEICRFQRPKSGAVNAKTKSILAFTIIISASTDDQYRFICRITHSLYSPSIFLLIPGFYSFYIM